MIRESCGGQHGLIQILHKFKFKFMFNQDTRIKGCCSSLKSLKIKSLVKVNNNKLITVKRSRKMMSEKQKCFRA